MAVEVTEGSRPSRQPGVGRVKSNIEESGAWERSIAIELDTDEVEERIQEVVKRVRRKVQLPGFRKGKVPVHVVENKFWDQIQNDVIQSIVPDAVNEVLAEHELRVASQPRVEDLEFERGAPLTFKAIVELWPELEIPDLTEIEVDEVRFELEEEDIERALDSVRDQAATLEDAERPSEEGDLVEVHIYPADKNGNRLPKGKRQDAKLEAGAANLLPEFREATVGVSVGEEKLIRVQYPEDHRDRKLAGGQRYYILRPTKVMTKVRPDLDDSFAAQVEEGLDLEGLRAKVREQLEKQEARRARQVSQGHFLARFFDLVPFQVPDGVIREGVEFHMKKAFEQNPNADPDALKEQITPQVDMVWRRRLILDSIARKEEIRISDEDVDAKIREKVGDGANVDRIREQLTRSGDMNGLKLEVLDDKVFDLVFEKIRVNESVRPRPKQEEASNTIASE